MTARRGESYETRPRERTRDLALAGIASLYTLFMIFAGGMKFVLLSAVLYGPGTLLYLWTRREQERRVFTRAEWPVFVLAAAGCAVAVHALATGRIRV